MTTRPQSKRQKKSSAAVDSHETAATPERPCVVGIGASAGGFEAIRDFFHAMPADTGVAFVVVQHLAPTHISLAAEIFSKFTAMPVRECVDGTLIEPNHVYTSPSDRDVSIIAGHLRLTARGNRAGIRLPIDAFFASLAEDCGARAIGIVFSGTGSDGALGLKAIAAHGGVVLVQQPETAQYDGMPRSAIATGIANYVLPVAQMPQVIASYAHHPYVVSAAEAAQDASADSTTQSLIRIIQTKRGYDFSGYKRGTLLRRIERRMGLHGILRQADYVTLLNADSAEVDALFRDLLIGVTEFFRDAQAWKALETEVIGPLIASKQSEDPVRIWIPGCSTGEEAYTMAMVVLDRLRRARKKCPVQIFATDTNSDALDVGRMGRYPIGITSKISPARLRRYFSPASEQQEFCVTEELRKAVVFGTQNLFADPPFGRVDLISCRNVLIYLEPEVQKRVLNIFHFALRRDAYLFLGSAESNCGRDDLFRPMSKKFRIFRREGSTRIEMLPPPLPVPDARSEASAMAQHHATMPPALSQVANIAQSLILDRFAPACVMVNADNQAIYFCGPTDEFLVRPRGAPSHDLLMLVREGLRARVRSALKESADSDLTVNVHGARMKHAGVFVPVQITVIPTRGGQLGRSFLVVFRHDQKPALVPSTKSANAALVRHLEEELDATRYDLQSVIERYEITMESLRVSNEEVVSTNEELRSLNEELESSKEELQSLNEELTTVNQQLESKVRELETSNSDLKNLLVSSDIATICLDESLRIKWVTPATQKQFNFIPTDIGRPIGDMLTAIGDSGLVVAARSVLATQTVLDKEFQVENGRWYIRRALPYRGADQQICGVIVTYTDITDSHLAIEAAKISRRDLAESVEKTDKLRILSAALATAEERERRLLAQDLHDDLGQILAVIGLKAEMMIKQDMPDALKRAVEECAKVVDQANRKLRTMALQLNPPMLDQLGLVPAIKWLSDEVYRLYKLEVDIRDDGKPKPMDEAVSATLFRAVRELLLNVCKHARVSKAVVTTVRNADDTLTVTVDDAGTGFDPDSVVPSADKGGFGLVSVRERLGYLGGQLSVRSIPGDGTSVVITVPLLPDSRNKSQAKAGGKA